MATSSVAAPVLQDPGEKKTAERKANASDKEFEQTDIEITKENVKFILWDGYQYCFNRMLGNAQRWKCSYPSCCAYFKILDNNLHPGLVTHCHPPQSEVTGHDELKRMPVQPQVFESSETPKAVQGEGKKRKYMPKLTQLVDDANSSDLGDVSDSVKKELARQWPLNMRCASAGSSKSGSVPVLPRNALQPHLAVRPNSTSPAMTESLSRGSDMTRTPSPVKSPKLSEMGPPPTPPPSQPSPSSQLEDPCSPGLPEFDLSELKYAPSADSSDFIFSQTSISNWTLPQDDSVVSTAPQPPSSESERFKYKEYSEMMMRLNNTDFGQAVTSLIDELSSQSANQVRSEIASLLYNAVEKHATLSIPKL